MIFQWDGRHNLSMYIVGSSGADQTMNATNSEPVHIFEMTNSSTPQPVQNPDAVKISE